MITKPILHVDTVYVALDIVAAADSFCRSPRRSKEFSGAERQAKYFRNRMEATVEAIMQNAALSGQPIGYVSLRVIGPPTYADLSAVRKVTPTPRRSWND